MHNVGGVVITRWKQFFRPIATRDEAEQVLKELAKAWYALGILTAVIYSMLFISGHSPFLNIVDDVVYRGAGFFLPRNKSRTFECIIFLWSLTVLFLTLATRVGIYNGFGKNFVLGLIVVGIAYRSMRATWIYQKES